MSDWQGCYDSGWGELLVPDAFSHPAKVAPGLAERIYTHAMAEGWLARGQLVVDPFGGIGGTALWPALHGIRWIGCELEPKFHALADENFAMWRARWGKHPDWCAPEMRCGDSRRLIEVLGMGAEAVVSSPPYAAGNAPGRKGQAEREASLPAADRIGASCHGDQHGDSPGQLGAMKEGNLIVSSPPYADNINARDHGIDWSKAGPATGNRKRGEGTKHEATLKAQLNYGSALGQLGAMREGDLVVSSPPYEAHQLARGKLGNRKSTGGSDGQPNKVLDAMQFGYSDNPSNMGNITGDTFWSAARLIVDQVVRVLRPGGHAIWVCKDFVRKGARVPFSDQWQALCEDVGLRTVCRHRALLVKDLGEQRTLFGEPERKTKARKSFFRRLYESRPGAVKVDWEDVICQEKAR